MSNTRSEQDKSVSASYSELMTRLMKQRESQASSAGEKIAAPTTGKKALQHFDSEQTYVTELLLDYARLKRNQKYAQLYPMLGRESGIVSLSKVIDGSLDRWLIDGRNVPQNIIELAQSAKSSCAAMLSKEMFEAQKKWESARKLEQKDAEGRVTNPSKELQRIQAEYEAKTAIALHERYVRNHSCQNGFPGQSYSFDIKPTLPKEIEEQLESMETLLKKDRAVSDEELCSAIDNLYLLYLGMIIQLSNRFLRPDFFQSIVYGDTRKVSVQTLPEEVQKILVDADQLLFRRGQEKAKAARKNEDKPAVARSLTMFASSKELDSSAQSVSVSPLVSVKLSL